MDDFTKQVEEVEALEAIYDKDFQIENESDRSFSVRIASNDDSNLHVTTLYFKFPDRYPSEEPPIFEISAPHLKHEEKERINAILNDTYLSHIGEAVIYQWIEKIREQLDSLKPVSETTEKLENDVEIENSSTVKEQEIDDVECSKIFHGETIVDRKSTFQGHVARISSAQQAKKVLKKLKENRKIQQATHNMYAYRLYDENKKCFVHDCDDDGEAQAGSRMMHLLEIMDVKNAIVVVSRWYGGIHLGPDRFKHINNAARQVLTAAGSSL